MKEIITLQVGSCGNEIARLFWEDILYEHNISYSGILNPAASQVGSPDVFLKLDNNSRFTSRSILINSNPEVLDAIRCSSLSHLYSAQNYVSSTSSSQNNFAKFRYEHAKVILEEISEALRKEAEICEKMQGFQLFHSLAGGTGSGILKALGEMITTDYQGNILSSFSVFPSKSLSCYPLEAYNSVIAMNDLTEYFDIVNLLDNDIIYKICQEECGVMNPGFNDLNQVIRGKVSGVTSLLRFPGQCINSLQKLYANCVPFPRLHFLNCNTYPFTDGQNMKVLDNNLARIALDKKYITKQSGNLSDRDYNGILVGRGEIDRECFEKEAKSIVDNNGQVFAQWIPDPFTHAYIEKTQKSCINSAAYITNSDCMKYLAMKLSKDVSEVFKKNEMVEKLYVYGIDSMDITEAESNANDLTSEFMPCCYGCFEGDDEDVEEGEFNENRSYRSYYEEEELEYSEEN